MIKTFFPILILVVFVYGCQPTAVRVPAEPHPVTEEGLIASSLYAADRIGSDEVKSDMLRRIALMKLAQNDIENAIDFAGQIPLQNEKDRTIADIAVAINQRGERDRARSLAAQIQSDYEKSRVIADVAVAYERAEEYRRGRELAEEIPDPNFKARAFAGIAVIYYAEGYGDLASRLFDQALNAAQTERSLTHHIETLLYIAEKYYESGRGQDAHDVFADVRRLAGDVRPEQQLVAVWGNILDSYREAGQSDAVIEDAMTIARAIGETERYFGDELLSRIAAALAITNDDERARAVAGEIEDMPVRIRTYALLAVSAHNINNSDKADGYLSEAIALSAAMQEGIFKQRSLRDFGVNAADIHRFETVDRVIGMMGEHHFAADVAAHAAGAALGIDDEDAFNRYLGKTLEVLGSVDDPVITSQILFDIAELYERSGYTPDEDTKLIVSKALHAVDE